MSKRPLAKKVSLNQRGRT